MDFTGILMATILLASPNDLPEPWKSLAMCESSLRPDVVSKTGKYHGLFQFDQRSWAYVGGTGKPSRATVREQLVRAKALKKIQGWEAWPTCSRKLGLK
jgi:hypothetical protein